MGAVSYARNVAGPLARTWTAPVRRLALFILGAVGLVFVAAVWRLAELFARLEARFFGPAMRCGVGTLEVAPGVVELAAALGVLMGEVGGKSAVRGRSTGP